MTDPNKTAAYTRTIVEAIQREHSNINVGELLQALADVAGYTLAIANEPKLPVSFAARVEGTRAYLVSERAKQTEGGER